MGEYSLKFGKKFDREFGKLDKSISNQIVKKLSRLKENPESFGKPLLHTKPILWEFKTGVYRIFYVIHKSLNETWILSVKHKNECDNYVRAGYKKDVNEF